MKKIILIIFAILLGVTLMGALIDARSFGALKASNPDQYLIQVREKDETKWLLELKALKPEQYETELRNLTSSTKTLPASDINGNYKAYKRLTRLEPGNTLFKEKAAHYKELIRAGDEWDKLCTDSKVEAYQKTKQLVKARLKSPRTAKFSSYGQTKIMLYAGCQYDVRGFADAQNGFGAMIRSHYSVSLTRTKAGWQTKDIRID